MVKLRRGADRSPATGVAALDRNGGGRITPEWVAALRRNRWQDWGGIRSRFFVRFSTEPTRAHDALKLAQKVVEELAAHGPTDEELNIVRRQYTNQDAVARRTVAFWMHWLTGMHSRGDTLDGVRNLLPTYLSTTPEEVRDVLARYITPERRVTIIGMPRAKVAAADADVKRAAALGGK